jgi:hypothetical protein
MSLIFFQSAWSDPEPMVRPRAQPRCTKPGGRAQRRSRTRRGLLKNEQLHALARDLNYGKRGRISNRDIQDQRNSCSCLTLILACIVYWQAKEIHRVILECDPIGNGIDIQLIEHISPIAWDNVILYREYVIDEKLVRV